MTFANRIIKMFFKNCHIVRVCLIAFIMGCNYLFAQNTLQSQLGYANSLFDDEKYFDAITEFKRLQYFDSLNQYTFVSNKLIGISYKKGERFNEAIDYFSKAELSSSNIDSLFSIKIEIIKTNLLRRTIYRAFELLKDLENDVRFTDKKDQIIYWKGWAHIFDDDWQKASDEFTKLNPNHDLKRLCENVAESQFSKTKAKVLSYILPGVGQFYTENYVSGILSLGWVTLWAYNSINAFVAERFFDGFMIADFLLLRFYSGNLQNAEQFAEERNLEASNWMLNYLQNNYLGEKP
jgi:hypothetical protein